MDELCPYYMFLGVPCEEFWHGDYTKFHFYVRAYDLKRESRSQEMWLQGAYNFNAFSTALSNLHFDGKRHKQNKYMEEPIRLIPLSETEKEKRAEAERQKTIAFFDRFAAKFEERRSS